MRVIVRCYVILFQRPLGLAVFDVHAEEVETDEAAHAEAALGRNPIHISAFDEIPVADRA
jgi:hypothetical protein